MWRHRFLVLTYVFTVLTTNLYVEGVPRPMEYLSEVKQSVIKRLRRSAINFHNAIRCYQPSVVILGTYGDYGCYCGFNGNRGYAAKALDETDECCKQHDSCYDDAGNMEKTMWESFWLLGQPLLKSYNSDCLDGEVVCAENSPYQDKLCNCDKEAAKCFHAASARYRPQLFNIDVNKYCEQDSNTDGLNMTYYENRYPQREEILTTAVTPEKGKDALFNITKESTKQHTKKMAEPGDSKDDDSYLQVNVTISYVELKQEQNFVAKTQEGGNKSLTTPGKPEEQPQVQKSSVTSSLGAKHLTSTKSNLPLKKPALRPVLKTDRMPPVDKQESIERLREHPKRPDANYKSQPRFANKHLNDPTGFAAVLRYNLYHMLSAILVVISWNSYAM